MDFNKEKAIHKQLLMSNTLQFTKMMFSYMNGVPYIVGEHHKKICEALDGVIRGECTKLIINIAPRYGKTLLVSQMFIAYGLCLNPKSRFLHLSYSGGLATDNSMAVKDILSNDYCQAVFDDLQFQYGRDGKSKWTTEGGGGVYATTTLGQITGFGAGLVEKENEEEEEELDPWIAAYNPEHFSGAIVIDDPIKPEDALVDSIRERVNRRFETTIRNRVNSRKTPIIIIMQRVHENDLCGYLQEIEPDDWKVLSLPCIEYDEEGNEKPLWEFKHTLEELHKIEAANSVVFETQYMQNPTPFEGLMYRPFKTYEELPTIRPLLRFCYTDSADKGEDYLCSICGSIYKEAYYVTDVLYTKKPMEFTEQAQAQMLCKRNIDKCCIEANNGGRGFARNVERMCREYGNRHTMVYTFTQKENKQVRIFQKANEVCNMVVFPSDWEKRWMEFANHVKGYRKEGRSTHDDAEDALTGFVEKVGEMINSLSDEKLLNIFQ